MARPTSKYDLVDRLIFGGNLRQQLIDWRAANYSFDAIAVELRQHDVVVSGETVRAWCKEQGIPTDVARSAS